MFLNCSTCFGRHTAHHRKLKNCNFSLWFYIRFWLPTAAMYVKPEAALTVFEFLMMGGVSPETCWTIKKHWNNKFYYTVASCWFFLWDLHLVYISVTLECTDLRFEACFQVHIFHFSWFSSAPIWHGASQEPAWHAHASMTPPASPQFTYVLHQNKHTK